MRQMKPLLSALTLVLSLFIGGDAMAFGPGGPGGPGIPIGPGGPGGAAMKKPVVPLIVIDKIKDKLCFVHAANSMKQCVNRCPQPDTGSETPDLKGAECMVTCIERLIDHAKKCY